MAITKVNVDILEPDDSNSIEISSITPTSVATATDGVAIGIYDTNNNLVGGALDNKNNSLQITIISTTGNGTSTAVEKWAYLKAGNKYPNKILGDKAIKTAGGASGGSSQKTFVLTDISRFENEDGTIKITFESGFVGSVYAIARRAGVLSKAAADVLDGIS